MEHIEGHLMGVRDARIYYQAWLPQEDAKAAVLVVHGLGEHCGRYMNLVNYLVPRGYAVYGLDHLGHGRSEGDRELVKQFRDYTDTIAIYYDMVKGWQPDKPVFLLGHSMGGLIATYYLLDRQADFQGAILSAPGLKAGQGISPAAITLSKILSVLVPKAGVMALDARGVSRDPAVVEAYVNDPLVFHGKTPARLGAEMLKAIERVTAEVETIQLPFLVMQGSNDQLVDPGGAQMLYDRASSRDKTIKVYEGLYHEVFNEPEREQVLRDVETWLEAHV